MRLISQAIRPTPQFGMAIPKSMQAKVDSALALHEEWEDPNVWTNPLAYGQVGSDEVASRQRYFEGIQKAFMQRDLVRIGLYAASIIDPNLQSIWIEKRPALSDLEQKQAIRGMEALLKSAFEIMPLLSPYQLLAVWRQELPNVVIPKSFVQIALNALNNKPADKA